MIGKLATFVFNPVGVAMVLVHWVVFAFALLGDPPNPEYHNSTSLPFFLLLINMVPVFLSNVLYGQIAYLTSLHPSFLLWALISAPLISLQWLVIGNLTDAAVREYLVSDRQSRDKPLNLD